MNEPPPSYTAQSAAPNDPPAYTFPTSFSIGNKTTTGPLVNPEQLKGHLSLLRAFAALRSKIEATPSPVEVERRWALHVGLAVER